MKNIRSYADLLEEKKRLEAALLVQKALIKQDIAILREDLKPVQHVMSTFGKMTSGSSDNPLIRTGLGIAGDLLLRSSFIAGGGWLTRLIAPLVVKNISNIFLKRKSTSAPSWIGKLLHRSNGHS